MLSMVSACTVHVSRVVAVWRGVGCRRVFRCVRCDTFCLIFFFFQAEDGIRDIGVTGVQTCALPISVCSSLVSNGLSIFSRSRLTSTSTMFVCGSKLYSHTCERIIVFETTRPALRIRYSDRKSTRLNSSHANISYAVFCLKKKTKQHT